MAKSPSRRIFELLSTAAVAKWTNDGEKTFATWFAEIYLDPVWSGWFAGATPLGVGRTNNPLESQNKVIKRLVRPREIIAPVTITYYTK